MHADYSNNILKRLEKKYKFKHVTIHGFRHTHATLLLEGGASIKETQDRLGHKNAETTLNTYSHVTEKAQRNALENSLLTLVYNIVITFLITRTKKDTFSQ